jgi:drug/metabolite transporter (DMT)-like permease
MTATTAPLILSATKLGSALRSPALSLALAALFWSGNFVAGRALRGVVDPVTLNFLRWLIALAIIAPFVGRGTLAALPALRREWRLILALGASGFATFHILVYRALQSTTATSALLILSLAPIATLLGSGWLGLERPTGKQAAGALISIAGACVLITRGHIAGVASLDFNAGDLWMLAAVAVWAAYSLMLRSRPADLPSSVALLLLDATNPLAVLGSPGVLLSIGYIALFASAIAFLLWSRGVSELGPVRAGQFVNLMPLFGAALALLILGEVPTWAELAGAALVLCGIAFVEHRSRDDRTASIRP